MDNNPLDLPIDLLNEQLIGQARALAWKHWHGAPYVLDFEELLSLAYKGLAEAQFKWPEYCSRRGFDPARTRFYKVYCMRRMEGSILDYKRSQDWVSRTVRSQARALRAAGQDQGLSELELAAGSGLTVRQVSDTLAAMSRRPVSFDPVEHDVADSADTESRTMVSDLLAEAVREMQGLSLEAQMVMALTFYHGLTLRQAAVALEMDLGEVTGLQQQSVLAVHQALARAAGRDDAR